MSLPAVYWCVRACVREKEREREHARAGEQERERERDAARLSCHDPWLFRLFTTQITTQTCRIPCSLEKTVTRQTLDKTVTRQTCRISFSRVVTRLFAVVDHDIVAALKSAVGEGARAHAREREHARVLYVRACACARVSVCWFVEIYFPLECASVCVM